MKIPYGRALGIMLLSAFLAWGWQALSLPPKSQLVLTTEPPIVQLRPFEAEAATLPQPATLSLLAVDAVGEPLPNARIQLQILTPPTNPWLSTDFPAIEGAKLLDLEAIASEGKLQIQQALPIRGNYQLKTRVSPLLADTFPSFETSLSLPVAENEAKYRNLAILVVILLIVGLIGGVAIGGSQQVQPGEIAPRRVRLLLSGLAIVAIAVMLDVNLQAELLSSHGSHVTHEDSGHASMEKSSVLRHAAGSVSSGGIEAKILSDERAIVGQATAIAVEARDKQTQQPLSQALVQVRVFASEEKWMALAFQGILDEAGKLSWQQSFFDGTPHTIAVDILPPRTAGRQFPTVNLMQEIDVQPVAPPLPVRILGLIYFTSIIAIGLVGGFWFKRYRLAA